MSSSGPGSYFAPARCRVTWAARRSCCLWFGLSLFPRKETEMTFRCFPSHGLTVEVLP
jgi:hypothetical protein